jgi:hypothetical protein
MNMRGREIFFPPTVETVGWGYYFPTHDQTRNSKNDEIRILLIAITQPIASAMGMRKRYVNKKNNPLTHSFSYGYENQVCK